MQCLLTLIINPHLGMSVHGNDKAELVVAGGAVPLGIGIDLLGIAHSLAHSPSFPPLSYKVPVSRLLTHSHSV
jgi:hypothetical protein